MKIAIVDYGVGNLHSIRRGLEMAGAEVTITRDPSEISTADGIVLPGVGAFKSAMEKLRPISGAVKEATSSGAPVLGICLGMQLLMEKSEESGGCRGLGWIKGDVVRLPETLKVPHMGWNSLKVVQKHPLLRGIKSGAEVYFVHSYYLRPENQDCVLALTEYGVKFPAVIADGCLFGTQFHPEKSGEVGLRILKNFGRIVKSGWTPEK
ncbi:MAG: imidazole glycerol phosphate synthase subunit HisH [Candidatus Hadarchaeales archaeon]